MNDRSTMRNFALALDRILSQAAYVLALPFVLCVVFIPRFWIAAFLGIVAVAILLAWLEPGRKRRALPVVGLLFCLTLILAICRFAGYVGYSDPLTTANIQTYAVRNWGWNRDDRRNTAYVTGAIARLGDAAYGRTFGDLMNAQKRWLSGQSVSSFGPVVYGTPATAPYVEGLPSVASVPLIPSTSAPSSVDPSFGVPAEERAAARHWWHRHIAILSDDVAEDLAAASFGIRNGNLIAASAYLQEASKDADTMRLDDVPDGWSNVAKALSTTVAATKAAVRQWRDFIDDGLPSEAVEAENLDIEVTRDVRKARLLAEQNYLRMGGSEVDF